MKRSVRDQRQIPVSVVIAMKNAASTVGYTLKSIAKQAYPVREIIVVDNKSSDGSVPLVRSLGSTLSVPLVIIPRKESKGVGSSFNLGAAHAASSHIVFMHSDCQLPTERELSKLMEPFFRLRGTIATYPVIVLPDYVWNTYNFWEKCLLARSVGKAWPGLNTKFDCVRKDVFDEIGGFDEIHFGEDIGIGSEDADMHIRLRQKGKVVATDATVLHLHYLGGAYRLADWIRNRKLLARSYGRHIRMHFRFLSWKAVAFGIKPAVSVLPAIPGFPLLGIAAVFIFGILYMAKMYTTKSTISDPRILLLPLLSVFLVYYETFWMIEAFLFIRDRKHV